MTKSGWMMLAVGLLAGVVATYGSRFVKVSIEPDKPAATTSAPQPPAVVEPQRLPTDILVPPAPPSPPAPAVRPAHFAQEDPKNEPATTPAPSPPPSSIGVKDSEANLTWPSTAPEIRLKGRSVEFTVPQFDVRKLQIKVSGAGTNNELVDPTKPFSFPQGTAGPATFEFINTDRKETFAQVRVYVPDAGLIPPSVTGALNGAFGEPVNASGPVSVYGGQIKFRVKGSNQGLGFVLVQADRVIPVNIGIIETVTVEPGVVDVRLQLPGNLIGDCRLLAYLANGQTQKFLDLDANLKVASLPNLTSYRPTIDVQKPDGTGGFVAVAARNGVYLVNTKSVKLVVTSPALAPDGKLVVLRNDLFPPGITLSTGTPPETQPIDMVPGLNTFRVGEAIGFQSERWALTAVKIDYQSRGPEVLQPSPADFSLTPGKYDVTMQFTAAVDPKTVTNGSFYIRKLDTAPGETAAAVPPTNVILDSEARRVVVQFPALPTGLYQLTVRGKVEAASVAKPADGDKAAAAAGPVPSPIRDIYGNYLMGDGNDGVDFKFQILNPAGGGLPSVNKGITFETGKYVEFPEFTPPRAVPEGFNPADKVETRVARMFYNRDAHRVAQIINREVKSYNAATVDVRRRAADATRDQADKAQDDRQRLEAKAVAAAQASRAIEAKLAQLQGNQVGVRDQEAAVRTALRDASDKLAAEQAQPKPDPVKLAQLKSDVDALSQNLTRTVDTANKLPLEIQQTLGDLSASRDREAQANEQAQTRLAEERRLREEQFRREVAAAREDPDTYAPGDPNSKDPVKQVSVSVVGEGLIQLRGPMKGINIIRMMINQLDSPVGQVRVGVHTVQVNGEREDRMEKVVADIQKYIDVSRFMTAQSAELLRKAIVSVAAQKAAEAQVVPGSQDAHDRKYLHAFFGNDFIEELKSLDSEFLKTGNKLLSLHCMDSTSLAGAMMLMALAKNTVREEILIEFNRLLATDLPDAEMNYVMAGSWSMCAKCRKRKFCGECFSPMAGNAKFQSLIGFFNGGIAGNDTLSPIQREFIRLAQIYKARLVTELELKQRVMERSLVEERLGQTGDQNLYLKFRQTARAQEEEAKNAVRVAEASLLTAQADTAKVVNRIVARVKSVESSAMGLNSISFDLGDRMAGFVDRRTKMRLESEDTSITVDGKRIPVHLFNKEGVNYFRIDDYQTLQAKFLFALRLLESFRIEGGYLKAFVQIKAIAQPLFAGKDVSQADFEKFKCYWEELTKAIQARMQLIDKDVECLLLAINEDSPDAAKLQILLSRLREKIFDSVQNELQQEAILLFNNATGTAGTLIEKRAESQAARRLAQFSRSPLDHKKFLDLLIDDVEDKYIEQLEGTRSHCSNIDNYLKRLSTALDDDFNRQYYQPMFRCVRTAGTSWDVTLGQIETTTVLTNNRALAKVTPAASMEFDLPKRDIVLVEAMKGAKAMMDDYGALLNDPTFLALVKMRSGQPPSMTTQGLVNGSPVRNLLPGLPTSSDEKIMAQGGSGRREFNSALEALIPDPAIYKLETGTGFEIRPVMSPDGQSVVFEFDYMYTTKLREPVRADEKHLGKVDRHFVHTDVQLGNYELREISKYNVASKLSRTGRGVALLQDIPGLGVLFRPAPSQGSALQQNIIMANATIFPTLFDLTGLRYAPAIADLDPLRERVSEFIYRNRAEYLNQQIIDRSAQSVDEAMRIPPGERRPDLYRPQSTIPSVHPDGYYGPGLNRSNAPLREGYSPNRSMPATPYAPTTSPDGVPLGPVLGGSSQMQEGLPLAAPRPSGLPTGVPLQEGGRSPQAVPPQRVPWPAPPQLPQLQFNIQGRSAPQQPPTIVRAAAPVLPQTERPPWPLLPPPAAVTKDPNKPSDGWTAKPRRPE